MKMNNVSTTVEKFKNEFDFSFLKNREMINLFVRNAIKKTNVKLHFKPENDEDKAYLKEIEKFIKKNDIEFFVESISHAEDTLLNKMYKKLAMFNKITYEKIDDVLKIEVYHSEKEAPKNAKAIIFSSYVTELEE